ncbi:hypothetical protein HQ585_20575 [candidate division KSB1 bacterium]|nr:hypothetical protein [candidate division KSB1 bacterium]
MEISGDQIKRLDGIVRNLRIALKNSLFYSAEHPIYVFAVNNLKSALDHWFQNNDTLELGFSPDHLYLDNKPVKEGGDTWHQETAQYLHMRGMVSLSITHGVDTQELQDFLNAIGHDRKTIQENGGIQKNISSAKHIRVKEIDYGSILAATEDPVKKEDHEVWQFLFETTNEMSDGDLPESKLDFLIDFFKDTQRTVKTLNTVYRDAVARAQDEEAVKNIREAIVRICEYFEQKSSEDAREIKVQLMQVISQLHPDLINILLEKTEESETEFDVVESITKDFSESEIAEFIESLIGNEDTFNENLLKIFDKLAPDSEKSGNVVSMVANKMFSRRVVNPDTLSKLQMSIREIFQRHPDSNFMNQIYKITVDAVVNKKIDTLIYVARLSPLINKFVQSMEGDQLKREELWLILNILWLENDADEFSNFSEKIVDIIPELIDMKDTSRIKEIVEFFTEKTRPEQKKDQDLVNAIKTGFQKVTEPATIEALISFIPEAARSDIDDISYVLSRAKADSASMLIDGFIQDKNPVHRTKYIYIFSSMSREISKEVMARLDTCEAHQVKDLFLILRRCAPDKAHLVAIKLTRHQNPQIRWEALNGFEPNSEKEIVYLFGFFKKEKHQAVKKQAAAVLLKTQQEEVVEKMFRSMERSLFNKKILIQLIEQCGNLKSKESFPHLQRIFLKRGFFTTKKQVELRVTALNSLAKLQTEAAKELVHLGLKDKKKRVREMSEILVKLAE